MHFSNSLLVSAVLLYYIVEGRSVSPDYEFSKGYVESFVSPEEFSYYRNTGEEIDSITHPKYVYDTVSNVGLGIPKAPGFAYVPNLGSHTLHNYGYYQQLPKGHLVHPPHYEFYPSALGLEKKEYGYHSIPFSAHHRYGHHHEPIIEDGSYTKKKNVLLGEHFVKEHGEKGESLSHGDSGYNADKVKVKDAKGDSLHLVETNSGNKALHDEEEYHGGKHFAKEGKSGSENHQKQGHRKGHNIKGFKKSHHLDETGKTEEYFDESHDEGGNYAFGGHSGGFGESGGSSFNGGTQDGKYTSGGNKKESFYDNEYITDKEKIGSGKFGGNKFSNNRETYGHSKELGANDVSGHHEYVQDIHL